MSCEPVNPLVTGGSMNCDSFEEFGQCELDCSTGTSGEKYFTCLVV